MGIVCVVFYMAFVVEKKIFDLGCVSVLITFNHSFFDFLPLHHLNTWILGIYYSSNLQAFLSLSPHCFVLAVDHTNHLREAKGSLREPVMNQSFSSLNI